MKRYLLTLIRSVLTALPKTWLAELFRICGKKLGVVSCACEGELGVYEAKLSDKGVLGYYLVHQTWESGIQNLLATLAGSGNGTFIDVGANIGLTLIPLKRANPQLRAIGIEADRENFGYLKSNIERNGLAGIEIHQCAVFSSDGVLEFELSGQNAGDHRIRGNNLARYTDRYHEADRQVVKADCRRLDTLLDAKSMAQPVGMKCDIQGAEIHLLQGGENTLELLNWLVVEYWPYGIKRAGCQPNHFFDILMRHFSHGGVIEPMAHDQLPQLVPIKELVADVSKRLASEGETAHCELLFTKSAVIQSIGRL